MQIKKKEIMCVFFFFLKRPSSSKWDASKISWSVSTSESDVNIRLAKMLKAIES